MAQAATVRGFDQPVIPVPVAVEDTASVADSTTSDAALIVATYRDPNSLARAAHRLRRARARHELELRRLILLGADHGGTVHVAIPLDRRAWTGARYGAIGGMAVGILWAPPLLASSIVFGVVGGLLGRIGRQREEARLQRLLRGVVGTEGRGIVAVVPESDLPVALDAMPEATTVETASFRDGSPRPATAAGPPG
jgi:hypothetical protein